MIAAIAEWTGGAAAGGEVPESVAYAAAAAVAVAI